MSHLIRGTGLERTEEERVVLSRYVVLSTGYLSLPRVLSKLGIILRDGRQYGGFISARVVGSLITLYRKSYAHSYPMYCSSMLIQHPKGYTVKCRVPCLNLKSIYISRFIWVNVHFDRFKYLRTRHTRLETIEIEPSDPFY